MPRVMSWLAWPRRSLTTASGAPLPSRIDACEWRSEWSEKLGYPAFRSSVLVRVPTSIANSYSSYAAAGQLPLPGTLSLHEARRHAAADAQHDHVIGARARVGWRPESLGEKIGAI